MRRREEGQVSLLILGYTVVAILLVLGTISVTSVQLARVRLYAVSDAAALDAADALDDSAYEGGIEDSVPLTDARVRQSAASYLRSVDRPPGVGAWRLAPQTGSPDGQSAVVRLSGRVDLPFVGGVLRSLGTTITVTVESRARAGLTP